MTIFVGQHFAELYGELAEDAELRQLDAACNELLAAYYDRQLIEGRVLTLAAMVRAPQLCDVARTRAEAVATAATALLQPGGEQAPLLRNAPAQPTVEHEADREPEPAAAA